MTPPNDHDGPSHPSPPLEPISRIEAALARLGAEHEPPVGWEARVLAATAPPRRRPWWWFAAPAMLAAAAALVLALWPSRPKALELAMNVEKGSAVTRMGGGDPQLGDVVHVTATGGGPHRGVWVYRNETELVVRCPGAPACHQVDDAVTADVPLTAIGTYQIVVLASTAPLPVPIGRFDDDVAAAVKANVTVSQQTITIR